MSSIAHGLALKHPVFNGPYTVQLDRETISTPKNYSKYYQKNPLPNRLNGWRVHEDLTNEDGSIVYGSIASGSGFEDTPDAEIISHGVNSKSPNSVAIGRHGNFLMWGFAGGPNSMTPSAKDVFANSVVYIAKFDRQFPRQRRKCNGRDAWLQAAFGLEQIKNNRKQWVKKVRSEGKSEAYIDRFGTPDTVVSNRAKKLFPRLHEKFGIDNLPAYLAELLKNRDYLYAEVGDDPYRIPIYIDQDCIAYNIANHDSKLIAHCVELLEQGQDTDRALRILQRYTDWEFETAAEWRKWLDQVKGSLYFTDTGGFRFCSDKYPSPEQEQRTTPANSWGSNTHPISLSTSVTPLADAPGKATLSLKIQIREGWHIYDQVPEGSPNTATHLTVSLPDSVQSTGSWKRSESHPDSDDENLTVFTNEAVFSLPISAEIASDLLNKMFITVKFQACTDENCLPPERAFIAAVAKTPAKPNLQTKQIGPPPTIDAEFITTDITSIKPGFRPKRVQMSKNLKRVKTPPANLENPLVGSFKFGKRIWMFIVDEPADKAPSMFVDSNQDGDFTNDPAPDYDLEGNRNAIRGSAQLNWSDDQLVKIEFYRLDPRRFKNSFAYYPDFGYRFTLNMDGKKFTTVHAGIPDKRLAFEVNRNGDDVIHRELERVEFGKPFNFTGNTYLLSLNDGQLEIGKASQPMEQMRMPHNFSAGQFVPEFTAETVTGEKVNFPKGYAGKIVMLDIWATWCAPCIMDIPHLKKAHDQWHDAGFEIIGISVDDRDKMKTFKQLIADKNVSWGQIAEGDGIQGRLGSMFEVTAVPFMLLVDGDTGKIIGTTKDLRGEKLSAFIGDQIQKKKKKKKTQKK